jgi:hypothetical protein
MATTLLKRQWIRDASGEPIGIILPVEEFALLEGLLEKQRLSTDLDEKLAQLEEAAKDPLFLADLTETMSAFSESDAEWWEPA